jgi:L-malate glycosyltransferase
LSVRPLVVDLGRDYRGGQHQALLLLRGLRARGHAPELIAVMDSLLALRAEEAGIPVHSIYPGRRRLDASLLIRRLVREHSADVVHANEPHALTSAWLARAHRSVPVIASRRIALPLSQSSFSLARYRAAARIVAVSHFVEKSVIASGLPSNCVEVIYDGVEIPPEILCADRDRARINLGIPQDSLCVGNVAAYVPEKGHEILLRAFARLRETVPGCILLLRGEGPERAKMQELARQLQVLEAVKFTSPEFEIAEAFAAMDVFAFSSHEEPLGSALLAAMAHGLPVVAIGRGGIPEAVESGKNGSLVNCLDPEAMAAAIAVPLANPEAAHLMGKSARETVLTRFSAEHMVDATLLLYENVTGER